MRASAAPTRRCISKSSARSCSVGQAVLQTQRPTRRGRSASERARQAVGEERHGAVSLEELPHLLGLGGACRVPCVVAQAEIDVKLREPRERDALGQRGCGDELADTDAGSA